MRWNITNKLFVVFLAGSLLLLVLSALLARWSFERGFLDYVNGQEVRQMARLADPIAEIYRHTGSLEALRDDPRLWRSLARHSRPGDYRRSPGDRGPRRGDGRRGRPRGPGEHRPGPRSRDCQEPGANGAAPDCRPPPGPPPGPPPHEDPFRVLPRIALFDANGIRMVGNPSAAMTTSRLPLLVDGNIVGELRIEPIRELTQAIDVQFARRHASSLYGIAIALLLISIVAALLVARLFTRPIKLLTAGSQRLASGVYDQPIEVTSEDELGELARRFNSVSSTLQKNRDARQRWLADISHELRTPLAILTGELQAIEDGVRPMNDSTRQSLQAEVLRLNQLVGDLHELSLSDEGGPGYRRDRIDVGAVLSEAVDTSRARLADSGIRVDFAEPSDPLFVSGDSARLAQLFVNLIETRFAILILRDG